MLTSSFKKKKILFILFPPLILNPSSPGRKVDIVKSLFLPFGVETILNMPLSYTLPKDKIIWVGNKKGEFTVKSAYYIALTMIKSPGGRECSHEDPHGRSHVEGWGGHGPPQNFENFLNIYIIILMFSKFSLQK